MGSSKPTITIMPGVHEERLVLKNSQVVTIRAADYRRGAALVWYHPCQNHSVNGTSADSVCSHCGHGINESVIEVEDGACLSIHNLTLLHYTEGTDLWHGNSAVYCHGNSTSIHMEGCSIQSDSGRGLVVSNGADVHVNRSTIHDCAATGAYIGDDGSYLGLGFSNVLRNGFGTRRPILDNDNNNGPHPPRIQAGHSGIYVEATVCSISHSFVALNCFTGLSVVRDSDVYLSKCHFAGNGEEPVIVFQDDDDDIDEDVDNPLASVSENSNIYDAAIPPLEQMERTMLRCNHVHHRPLSPEVLQAIFGA